MKRNILFKIALLLAVAFNGYGQEVLTVEEAVQIALKNNYDIKLASNDLEVSKENKSLANAGMLPRIDGTFTQNNNIQNTKQTQSTGEVRELNDAKNNNMTYGVNLGWTVFDGLKMFARYDQLQTLEKQGEVQLKSTILTKVSDVMTTYYDLVKQQQLIKALDTTIVISKQRLKLAENRFSIGKASKLEVLNAQVDMNQDLSNLLLLKQFFQISKVNLNALLARDSATDFKVEEEVTIDENLQLQELQDLVEKQNPQLQLALINKRVAELDLKQVRAERYPLVRLNSGYNFNKSESSLGFVSQSSSNGFNYGVAATLNIFNGFLQTKNEKIAKLQVDNSSLLIEQERQSISSELHSTYQTYLTNVELVKLEEHNEDIAKKNLEITLEKFKLGSIPTIEFRNAQENYINVKARNTSAKFQAKISEVMLNEIAGNIKF
ncbi:outer membrane efflux protein [Flavobacterium enshiense DK69]|uniref:TolC family protein n=1 Tax=Flavobacterium enshiense TaxID=1341165 RepID=UPI0003C5F756|nr:TolC family protein [Flavobacterium enshiense]ESU23320.1 outer membrane efflux protein [Flavobacterium enshiense DK69]